LILVELLGDVGWLQRFGFWPWQRQAFCDKEMSVTGIKSSELRSPITVIPVSVAVPQSSFLWKPHFLKFVVRCWVHCWVYMALRYFFEWFKTYEILRACV
jgi:hypothetical protein